MAIEWTSERRELHADLHAVHADIGELYGRAIDALSDANPISRAQLMVAGHCIRESFSILPVILRSGSIPERIDTNRATKELHQAWAEAGLELDAPGADNDSAVRPVPIEVFRAAQTVARVGTGVAENSRLLTAIVATGQRTDSETAPVRRLHGAIEKFRTWTHRIDYNRPEAPVPPPDEIELELQVIEAALMVRLANRADSVRVVRDTLAEANRREGATSER